MMEKIDELEQIPLHFVSENHEKSFQNVRRRSGSAIKGLLHVLCSSPLLVLLFCQLLVQPSGNVRENLLLVGL